MKKELLQALAIELAGILQREKKELTRDQLFMRCRDGVSLDDVIDAMTELCRLGAVRAHGGAYKFERMPVFDTAEPDTLESEATKPEADLPSPVIEPVSDIHAAERPVHYDSVDRETMEMNREQQALKQLAEGANKMVEAFFGKPAVEKADRLKHVRSLYQLVDEWSLSFRQGRAIECILADDLESAIAILQELAEKQQ